jgi:hypothetical protein
MLDMKFEDVSQETLDDEIMFETMDYFSVLKNDLGMDSIWDLPDATITSVDTMIFEDKQYKVKYKFIESMGATMDDVKWAEVTSITTSSSIKDLWFAANSCIKRSGTHHNYIEGFELSEDGFTLNLITGS